MQINDSPRSQMVFGLDVDGLNPDQPAMLSDNAFGYPVRYLRDVPPGDYFVQAVLHRYETFHRSDGHTVKLPMDRGEGQHWNLAPGNLYSTPRKISIGKASELITVVLDKEIPAIPDPQDTKYIRHVKIKSELLSKFWDDQYSSALTFSCRKGLTFIQTLSFPLIIAEDHFNHDFGGFRTVPPDPNLKPDYSERFHVSGYNRIQQEEAYKFYQQWISPKFPRILIAEINHANPYYDDSYAVNSAILAIRRCNRNRVNTCDRETISRYRAGMVPIRVRGLHRRMEAMAVYVYPITTMAHLSPAQTQYISAPT